VLDRLSQDDIAETKISLQQALSDLEAYQGGTGP